MVYGIDVDGVLTDIWLYQMNKAIPYFKKHNIELKHEKEYDIKDIFECTDKQREKFWSIYIWEYCLRLKMTDGAAETVRILKQKGNQIYIITGRAHTKEKGVVGAIFRKMLKYWLRKNKFVYDKIFYVTEEGSSEEKYNICIQENIDVLVDDKPTNLLPLKDKLKIVCFPAKWNEDNHDLDKYRIKCFEDLLNV
jgi:uncharacterized HAD superfamily protein